MLTISQSHFSDSTIIVKWELGPTNYIKINWDVTIQKQSNKIGIRIVLRDWEGFVLISVMKPLQYCSNATLAKPRGLFEAINLCKELGLSGCLLECNLSQEKYNRICV